MNFIFISPNFPHTYWNFCDRLKKNGVNVLGIGDAPYDGLEDGLKGALTEYYKVDSLENYDQVFRAVAFFSFKYGKIDWIESLNEYWLEQDARLRTDFNVTTGIQSDRISFIKEKSLMKKLYQDAGIPTARQSKVTTREDALKFIDQIGGYPVIVKPDIGVGANDTWKLNNDEQLNKFYDNLPSVPYVMEEFIVGDLISYEAILNSKFEPLFENMTTWPTPIMEIVNDDLNLKYYTNPDVPEKLREIGRRTSKGVRRRPPLRASGVLPPDQSPQGPGQEGRVRRTRSQHAPAGRLYARHDELRALHGCLSDLRGHGGFRRETSARVERQVLLRLRGPQGRT